MLKQGFPTLVLLVASSLSVFAADAVPVARWTSDAPATGETRNVADLFANAQELGSAPVEFAGPEALPVKLSQLTFSAWIAPSKLTGNHTILRKEDGDTRLLFALQDGKFLTLGLNCGRNYSELDAPVLPQEIADGKWHFVAGTFDGKTMRVYLDGREIGSQERQVPLNTVYDYVSGRADPTATVVGAPFKIGAATQHKRPTSDIFNGKITDVRFYATALGAAQIAALHAEAKLPAAPELASALSAAKALYAKGATYFETLAAIEKNLPAGALDARVAIELHRLLRADFPEEADAYVVREQKSTVDNLLLSAAQRRDAANRHADLAFEYLPLTDLQWSVLSKPETEKWQRVKAIKALVDDQSAAISGTVLCEIEGLINQRPRRNEAVAKKVALKTPETKARSVADAQALIEKEWLFQCDGAPTLARTLQEVGYARKILGRIRLSESLTAEYTTKLDILEAQVKEKLAAAVKAAAEAAASAPAEGEVKKKPAPQETQDKELYFAVRTVKREITFKNPVLDFDSLLYTDSPYPSGSEWTHETRHQLGYMAVPGGRLLVQKGLQPNGALTQLAPSAPIHGSFWRPDLSFDASKVVFSFKPHNEKTFHLYEIGIDGTGLRQLSAGIFDDFDPIYLPDGKNIMFTTTRGYLYVRCMPPTNAMVTAKMPLDTKPGDKNLYIISRNGEPEYTPSVMNDGRILFTRWEYTDKPLWRAQKLWTMEQNGKLVQTFWGNQSVWPDLLKDARNIPGSNRVMFTGSAHHNWFAGSVGIIDPAKGLNFPQGLAKVTQDVEWPECRNGPVDPKENDTYHTAGRYVAYYSPYPLSETDFLVSAKRTGRFDNPFVLLLMDTDGNREIINEGAFNIFDAQPVRKRPVPPAQTDTLSWPTWEERENPAMGQIYSNNVYEGAPPELKDKAKYLRIWSIEHKTYTYWYKRPTISTGPEISINQSDGVKKIIGTVPIEDDGSVNFRAPSGVALHFQLLDKDHRALQTMKSFTGVQPGEVRACFGCHEQGMQSASGAKIGKAMRKMSNITPVPWKDVTVGFERYVQPALDKYCGECHQKPGTEAFKKFNATLRPGYLGFKEPYATLLGDPTWGGPYHNRKTDATPGRGAFGWADTILVESFSQVAPAAYATYPAMTRLSYKSRLVKRLAGEKITPDEKHPVIKADKESLLRVILWVDAMGPYYGAEEVRKMEDPQFQGKDWISQPPRIHTAPTVTRPGPFDPFHTDTDPAYFTPSVEQYNALPAGVKRPEAADARYGLEWVGVYAGRIPSASGMGIDVTITLNADQTYAVTYHYVGRGKDADETTIGKFTWDAVGNAIKLDAKQLPPHYQVKKDTLVQLDMEGAPITGGLSDSYVLKRSKGKR